MANNMKVIKCVNCGSEDLGRRGFSDAAKTKPILTCKICGKRKTYTAQEVEGTKFDIGVGASQPTPPAAETKTPAAPAPILATIPTAPVNEEVVTPISAAPSANVIKFRFGRNGIINEITCDDWNNRATEIEREMNCTVSHNTLEDVWEFIPKTSTKGCCC